MCFFLSFFFLCFLLFSSFMEYSNGNVSNASSDDNGNTHRITATNATPAATMKTIFVSYVRSFVQYFHVIHGTVAFRFVSFHSLSTSLFAFHFNIYAHNTAATQCRSHTACLYSMPGYLSLSHIRQSRHPYVWCCCLFVSLQLVSTVTTLRTTHT